MSTFEPFPALVTNTPRSGPIATGHDVEVSHTAGRHPFAWGFFVALGVTAAGLLLSGIALIGFAVLAGVNGKL